MNHAVKVNQLKVRFGDFYAVNDISFSVNRGEIFGFLGANGAGKTTTIRVLCGLLSPTSGNVEVAGASLERDGIEAIKYRVGYMSQKFTLYNDLTVAENLAFTASLRKLDKKTLTRRTEELFDFINFDRSTETMVRDLPGGIKQQVSLVAATLHDPDVVFLDEPTAGVTPLARARFWDLIRSLSKVGKTIFVTTHYMDEAEQCGRIALMRAGQIIALDTPDGLKDHAFPEPLFEIEEPAHASAEWLTLLKGHPAVRSVQPYGLRHHVSVRESAAWDELQKGALKGFKAAKIRPSLEDVFIRLVEGDNR